MADDSIRVLFVDRSEDDTERAVDALESSGFTVDHRRVDTYTAFDRALKEQSWDLVMCDRGIPRVDTLVAWSTIQQRVPDLPFLVFSALVQGEQLVELLDAGVQHFADKHQVGTLAPKVRALLRDRPRKRGSARKSS